MRSREGVGVLMPLGNSGEKGAFAGRSSSGPRTEPARGLSLGLGKERAQGGAGVGLGGGGGDLSHEMTECRKEAREGLIHEHHLSAYCVPRTVWALGTRPGIWRIRLCRCRTRSEPEPESNTCNAKLQF